MADDKTRSDVAVCGNSDCRVADTGKCIEGLDVAACPHYGHAPEGAPQQDDGGDQGSASSRSVVLPGADTLTAVQVPRLLRAGKARVIAIIGPTDAGKTSLIASLYDLFQQGPVSGIHYARSVTLHAFEQTCHDARAASRRQVPHINRTPRGEVRFYHVDLGGGPGDALTLALGDRAGEEYRTAADDASVVGAFQEIWRADSLTALVDGERILNSGDRHNVRSEITMMLQALVDGGAVQAGQRLALVLTKIDVVQASPNQVRAEGSFCALLASLRKTFGHVFSVIEPFRIAASPKTEAVQRGTGVPDLLDFWIKPTPAARAAPPTRPAFSRAFARLAPLDA